MRSVAAKTDSLANGRAMLSVLPSMYHRAGDRTTSMGAPCSPAVSGPLRERRISKAEALGSIALLPRVASGDEHDNRAAQHVPPQPLALHGPRVDLLRRHAGQQVGCWREQARLQHAAAFLHRHAPGQAPQQLVADVVALQAGGAQALPSLLVVLWAEYQSDSAEPLMR